MILRHFSIVPHNSKRRHLMRKKVSVEKEEFKSFIEAYNEIVTAISPVDGRNLQSLDVNESLETFPWRNMDDNDEGILIYLFYCFFQLIVPANISIFSASLSFYHFCYVYFKYIDIEISQEFSIYHGEGLIQ